jgi:hypothetical protein
MAEAASKRIGLVLSAGERAARTRRDRLLLASYRAATSLTDERSPTLTLMPASRSDADTAARSQWLALCHVRMARLPICDVG